LVLAIGPVNPETPSSTSLVLPPSARPPTSDPTPTETRDWSAETRTLGVAENEAAPACLPGIGTTIDKYRIEELLGSGGFATVYRATHLLMRTPVALKLLHPWVLRRRPHLVEQLCEEARFTSLINHPNVVRVFDVTKGDLHTYIVMEYIDGISLYRAIERQPLRPLNVLRLGMHVCAGLHAGLTQGLIHRDVKPGNILITKNGRAKLVDFGLARHSQLEPSTLKAGTPAEDVAGTPAYMAPEQATNPTGADFRADIYSLGATLYHAALGVAPFTDPDPLRLVYSQIHHDPPDPRQFISTFPAALSELLLRMLAKQPDRRPGSYEHLAAELRGVYDQLKAEETASETKRSGPLLSRVKNIFVARRE
jgi:serine/threonine protein kinase